MKFSGRFGFKSPISRASQREALLALWPDMSFLFWWLFCRGSTRSEVHGAGFFSKKELDIHKFHEYQIHPNTLKMMSNVDTEIL